MLDTYEQHSKKKLVATVLAIIVIAGAVIFADKVKSGNLDDSSAVQASASTAPATSNATTSTATSTPTATSSTTTPTTNTSGYKDGSYTATTDYYVPNGTESIRVDLTISSGAITTVFIQNSESDRDSARYQQDFSSVYKSYVVGKKISGLRLGVLAGASDTTQGFVDALSQIASKARA